MAVVTAGDILEFAWSNPNLGSGFFFPTSNVDNTLNIGGLRNNDQPLLDGAGRLIAQKNRMAWMVQCEFSNDMLASQEFETASAIAADLDETIFTITHISGAVYRGPGVIFGDVELNANKGTFTIKAGGGQQLEQI